MYNNTTQIKFSPAYNYITNYHLKMYGEEEELLDVFFKITLAIFS
jgi:hypothetical protein